MSDTPNILPNLDSDTPRSDAAEAEFLGGRSLTWLDVAAKSRKLCEEMREIERERREAAAEIERLERERAERIEWVKAWHDAVDTAATILELPHALPSPSEFLADIQQHGYKLSSAERQRDEAYATVKRIWQALGITDYQQAQPSGIAEHVESVLRQRDEAIAATIERCAKVADEHRARVPGHNPDEQGSDLVAHGYGNAALNIACEIRRLLNQEGTHE